MTTDELQARTDAVRALEAEFAELLNRVRRILTENAQRVSPGMMPGAYKVFTTIARRGPIAQSTLAELLVVDKGQLSRTVRELEGLELIRRDADPDDRRASILIATPLGLERLAAARAPQENSLIETLEEWSVPDIHSLTRLLHALTSGISPS
ncbi:MAG: transcriptional regulator [Microbacterium sp. SCN 70-27]|uniref:MarR family winged helix-turn-helix transcriptional regulator n=1 Tax=unclassified Microbacterium TaxID=2609290 RepID=UPI00086AF3BA|nr:MULTISPECIES: MarR family transcriptional regulator [unclassified Microbacterium]MBN9224008.1 MarR family transcriptional regulator [Microbacterium sp.]ODT26323.1 MAG: transcriptional regulator [Microbacterium sp. SCN 70-27]